MMKLDYNKFDRNKFKVESQEFSLDFSLSFKRISDWLNKDKEIPFGNPVIKVNRKCKPEWVFDMGLRECVMMDHFCYVLGEFEYNSNKWIFKFLEEDCGGDRSSTLSYAEHAKLAKFIESKDLQSRLKKLSQYLI